MQILLGKIVNERTKEILINLEKYIIIDSNGKII
jgi:hypothetical protein